MVQVDLLKMINAMEMKEFQAANMYFNHVDRSDSYLKYHIFCLECKKYFGNTSNLSEFIDCNCRHVITVSSSNYFLFIDLESQFKTF